MQDKKLKQQLKMLEKAYKKNPGIKISYEEKLKSMTKEELLKELSCYTNFLQKDCSNEYIENSVEKNYYAISKDIRQQYEKLLNEHQNLLQKLEVQYELNPSNDINYLLSFETSLYDDWLTETNCIENEVKVIEEKLINLRNRYPSLIYYNKIYKEQREVKDKFYLTR